ncbi:phloretin 4'-O-glucosyltransferase-like isoform X5 [Citrus sinensis]|uniref:phloretin 4'-O-glucosyltransferase-like isoform X5 n=1 Tax=Citrus sinensis TaxID=2711 RepID=UPI0022778FFC|nr:phloretin 4'-O-glucosyltransferase-like isoform X5 [Citrus sinensis]
MCTQTQVCTQMPKNKHMEQQQQPHFLLLTFPIQGHINPSLQFARRLTRIGTRVTFAIAISAYRRMANNPTPEDGLSFASFSDGYDDGFNSKQNDRKHYMSEFKRRSSEALAELITASQNEGGQPFTCLVYPQLLPWAAEVARAYHLPSALLWLQPALVFDVYYYYFYGYGDLIEGKVNDLIELPGLPPLTGRDLPSFLDPRNSNDAYSFVLPSFKEQMEAIVEETDPRILVNTFDALEAETLKAIDKFNMIAIGPLVASALLDGKEQYGGDLCQNSSIEYYMEWLSSKPKSSVIYVAFGTICVLEKRQVEEIARGLLDSGHPFLWVSRQNDNKDKGKDKDKDKDKDEVEDDVMMKYKEELNEKGMIVPWCSQVEVLSHEAVGCFVTHCGWSSSLESLVYGVPVVAFPQWTDQGTNAKIIVDFCKTGVRVRANEEGIVESDEINRCLELVMGEGDDFRRNSLKWKDLARDAVKQGGSSHKNLKAFVDDFSTSNCKIKLTMHTNTIA